MHFKGITCVLRSRVSSRAEFWSARDCAILWASAALSFACNSRENSNSNNSIDNNCKEDCALLTFSTVAGCVCVLSSVLPGWLVVSNMVSMHVINASHVPHTPTLPNISNVT